MLFEVTDYCSEIIFNEYLRFQKLLKKRQAERTKKNKLGKSAENQFLIKLWLKKTRNFHTIFK